MKLSELPSGSLAQIVSISGDDSFTHRLSEMGFIIGQEIEVIKNAPFHDPIEYKIMGYLISLRRSEASKIEMSLQEVHNPIKESINTTSQHLEIDPIAIEPTNKNIKVALVGNPNCGKTSLFNKISGRNEHVGNYSGVTIDSKTAILKFEGYTISITDLPGTYSITDFSPEEKLVREYLQNEKPDIVINVVDASNLERNLYLTTQLIDMSVPFILSPNMWDEFIRSGNHLNKETLSTLLGSPVIPTVAKRGRGVAALLEQIVQSYTTQNCEKRTVNYPPEIEAFLGAHTNTTRYQALILAEKNDELNKVTQQNYKSNVTTTIATSRFAFVKGALKEALTLSQKPDNDITSKIDRIITHKYLGVPIFIGILWLMFYTTFTIGDYPMGWIESVVGWLRDMVFNAMPNSIARDLIVNGIIDGVGSVIIFLPNILILFLIISIMEDTGYMSRAAFITDKLMHKIGLHGKSFIPLVMGFGCNVPAIMATRTIENRSNRLQTMLIAPFISCSARLPVYILIVGTFFSGNETNALFLIYFAGLFVAILSSIVFKKLFFRKPGAHFVMELPPYRLPTIHNTIKQMWMRASQYLKKMGGIILLSAIIVWALGYFPHGVNDDGVKKTSCLQTIGQSIEPVLKPLGFDWKMGVSLMSGVVAKEIVVSSMSVLYNENNSSTDEYELSKILAKDPNWTTATAISFLTFVLLYFPCVASIAAIRREANGWKWAVFTVAYTTGIAWVFSFLTYNIAKLII